MDQFPNNFLIGVDPSINGSGIFIQNVKKKKEFYTLVFCQTKKEFKICSESRASFIFPVKTVDKKLFFINRAIINSKIICKFIREMTNQEKCYIAIEGFSFGSHGKLASIGEFVGILEYELLMDGHRIKEYAPTSVKKFFTGKGNANKNLMVETFVETSIGKSFPEEITKLKCFQDITDSFAINQLLQKEFDCKTINEIPKVYEKIFKNPFYEKMSYIDYISETM